LSEGVKLELMIAQKDIREIEVVSEILEKRITQKKLECSRKIKVIGDGT